MSKITVRQKVSCIGHPDSVRLVLRGLGLRRVGAVKTHKDTNCIRGMINKVKHMVVYELSDK